MPSDMANSTEYHRRRVLTLQVYSLEQSYKAKRCRTQPIGIPRMLQNSEIQGTCMVELPGKFQAVDIRRQEPSQGLDSSESEPQLMEILWTSIPIDSTKAKPWQED